MRPLPEGSVTTVDFSFWLMAVEDFACESEREKRDLFICERLFCFLSKTP